MKVYSIGRESSCDIVIQDNTDVVSRRHALLNVSPSGKMTITDCSSNGTYVNGIRITPNVPVPITRKDSVSFAHVARLNWDLVPKGKRNVIIIIAAASILAIICGMFGVVSFINSKEDVPRPTISISDTISDQKVDSLENAINKIKDQQKQDSIKAKEAEEKAKAEKAKKETEKKAKAEKAKKEAEEKAKKEAEEKAKKEAEEKAKKVIR